MTQTTGVPALFIRAVAFAADKHRDQRRKGANASPYINHPIDLTEVLVNAGVTDTEVLCVAILHDTVEDTETTPEELDRLFGPQIGAMVMEVTDDKTLDKATRKQLQIEHAPHISTGAKLVKLADKICNVRDMLDAPPAGWTLERRQDYFDWADQVVAGLRGVHPVLEAVFDGLYARRGEMR